MNFKRADTSKNNEDSGRGALTPPVLRFLLGASWGICSRLALEGAS